MSGLLHTFWIKYTLYIFTFFYISKSKVNLQYFCLLHINLSNFDILSTIFLWDWYDYQIIKLGKDNVYDNQNINKYLKIAKIFNFPRNLLKLVLSSFLHIQPVFRIRIHMCLVESWSGFWNEVESGSQNVVVSIRTAFKYLVRFLNLTLIVFG